MPIHSAKRQPGAAIEAEIETAIEAEKTVGVRSGPAITGGAGPARFSIPVYNQSI